MSTRAKSPLEYLKDYHCNLNVSNTSSRVKYPLDFVLSYNKLSPCKYFVMSLSSYDESNTYSKAMKHDCWRNLYNVRYMLWSQIKRERLLFCPRTKLSWVVNGYSKQNIRMMGLLKGIK